jgi:hypothetical protein
MSVKPRQSPAFRWVRFAYSVGIFVMVAKGEMKAQTEFERTDSLYRVETHIEFGPMASFFLRGRPLPVGAASITAGYNATIRIMWHPDHLLAVGVLTGYQLIVSDKYNIPDSTSNGNVSASLHAVPVMVDVSMQGNDFEIGVALGGYSISTLLFDVTTSRASRLELGAILHAAYHWRVSDNFSIGAEAFISAMSYRGILSITPQLDLKYNIFTY